MCKHSTHLCYSLHILDVQLETEESSSSHCGADCQKKILLFEEHKGCEFEGCRQIEKQATSIQSSREFLVRPGNGYRWVGPLQSLTLSVNSPLL